MTLDHVLKVLILEDDADDCWLLEKQLRNGDTHFAIEPVETLAAAIAELRHRTFDAVITDLSVPDSIGVQTVAELRKHAGEACLIALTALDDAQMEKEILAAGAQDYLIKGELSARTVSRAILHAIQRQRSLNEVNSLVLELEQSHVKLRQQAELLKKKNRRLRRLYKTAQEFVDNVSHDFRTPLTVIKDYVSIIREGMVGDINAEQEQMLAKIGVRADDLNTMVDDLLDGSKLESGLLGAWRRKGHTGDILERVESLLQQRAQVRNVELTVDYPRDLPEIYCDAEKAGRVLTNLAINAIKFSGEHGRVRITAQADPENHQVIVQVQDNGPGIDDASLAKIFKRFRQADRHTHAPLKGFGLGLSIAQKNCAD